jgi:hypothetical protein
MRYVRHPSLNDNGGGSFNPAFAELQSLLNGSTAPVIKPTPKPEQPELPLDLPPRLTPKRWPRGSVGPRVEALAVLCERSVSWARQVERLLAEEGIDGAELVRLIINALLRTRRRQDRDHELSRAFNLAPRDIREQLVELI